jgi:branched-chain amino acid transport system substrate-binding protein
MRHLLIKAAAPLVAGALVLAGLSGAAFANAKHQATTVKPTYILAFEGPLSGGNAQLGLNIEYAVKYAIANANSGKSQFGKLPFTLTFLGKDDQGSGTISPTDAEALVANKSVIGVVGPVFSAAGQAAGPTFSSHDLATVSPSETRTTLAQHGWKNFFRVVSDDSIQGPADANYVVNKLKLKKLYVVNDASVYGLGLANAFGTQAKKDGAKVTAIAFPGTSQCSAGTASTTQYTDDAAAVVNAKAQLLFYGGYYCDLGLLLGALHSAGYKGKVFSADGSDSPSLIAGTNPHSAANGVYASCACAVLGTTKTDKVFAAGFRATAKFAPGIYSSQGYDAANAIIDAMKLVAEHGGTAAITRENVVTALHKLTFVGLTKTIHFESDGNITGTAIYVNQVQHGQFVQLGLE